MYALTCRNAISKARIPSRCFATSFIRQQSALPKEAAGPFTSNSKIASTSKPEDKTLVYLGPFAETIRKYKITASLFTICGMCAVPALLSTGQAPVAASVLAGISAVTPTAFIHWLSGNYVSKLIVYDQPRNIRRTKDVKITKDMLLEMETFNAMGKTKTGKVMLSQLREAQLKKDTLIGWTEQELLHNHVTHN
ncbi:hypothetical protein K450DRAFT_241498 [Umbelopsis ramanniana AG]|uniref:Uncharacterized protein n=1 Tax=Umbelopsis ramanniana AG TaxID=1314678 RepID=A0AAD5E9D3_UMBRA|nr:uncharacterized protein K450DRAFT_241498 [Umbelopsis ramanniana AG]KAI8579548.1 hypothetical protein K450DRAFT_241498 [Umbelopsis ramanniana AG]